MQYWRRAPEAGNHWFQVNLYGKPYVDMAGFGGYGNRDGLGSRVTVTSSDAQGGNIQQHVQIASTSRRLVFGLGTNTFVRSIRIEWPSGIRQYFDYTVGEGPSPYGIGSDEVVEVVEDPLSWLVRPGPVRDLSAQTLPTWDGIRLDWTKPALKNAPFPFVERVDRYEIWRSVDGGAHVLLTTVPATSAASPCRSSEEGTGRRWPVQHPRSCGLARRADGR